MQEDACGTLGSVHHLPDLPGAETIDESEQDHLAPVVAEPPQQHVGVEKQPHPDSARNASAIAARASLSDFPGARLNEIVEATKCPW